jgi:type VI secretion system protein ImpJ
MPSASKVVWSEGMLLRTQHFQQQDRWVEQLVRGTLAGAVGHGWGVSELDLDRQLLPQGKVGLLRCRGIMPDGTPFALPEDAPLPDPITVDRTTRPGVVYLALPLRQDGSAEIEPNGSPPSGARWRGREVEVRDVILGAIDEAPAIEIAEPGFKLLHESEPRGDYATLGVARLRSLEANGTVLLDEDWIPPCLRVGAVHALHGFLDELDGKLASIAKLRAARVVGRAAETVGNISDLLVLQLINRALPLARHFAAQRTLHPEPFYGFLASLAGEAATFTDGERLPAELPAYDHDAPSLAFLPLFEELRQLLAKLAEPDPRVMEIPLRLHPSGVRTAVVADRTLFTGAMFVIAVSAAIPAETLRQRLPQQIKIGPAEELQAIIRAATPGIPLLPLAAVPREIPLHRGMTYFELERRNDYWRRLPSSAALAILVIDVFPELVMECWAIRD